MSTKLNVMFEVEIPDEILAIYQTADSKQERAEKFVYEHFIKAGQHYLSNLLSTQKDALNPESAEMIRKIVDIYHEANKSTKVLIVTGE